MDVLNLLYPQRHAVMRDFLESFGILEISNPRLLAMLSETIICWESVADFPGRPTNHSQDPVCQSEIVDHCIRICARKSIPNIISFGYKKPSEKSAMISCISFLDNYFPNTHVSHLKSPLWQELLQIIGQDCMVWILLKTSLFQIVGTCLTQFCGRII